MDTDRKTSIDPFSDTIPSPGWDCRHEWRVIENFYAESSRSERTYGVYCVHCLESRAVEITLNKK